MNEFVIDNIKLIELFEIINSKYGKIKVCKTEDFEKDIYVLDGKIIKDNTIIEELETEAGLKLTKKSQGIIY